MNVFKRRFLEKVDCGASSISSPHVKHPCWTWTASTTKGYGKLQVEKKLVYAHRYSYQLYVGILEAGKRVCHRCDNPLCVRPSHLFLGSQKDNLRDASLKGRLGSKIPVDAILAMQEAYLEGLSAEQIADQMGVCQHTVLEYLHGSRRGGVTGAVSILGRGRSGSAHKNSKLSEGDIVAIHKASEAGESRVSLARKFGVAAPTISNIVNRKSWTHL